MCVAALYNLYKPVPIPIKGILILFFTENIPRSLHARDEFSPKLFTVKKKKKPHQATRNLNVILKSFQCY